MSTPEQRAANQRNAQKSTGPSSSDGKTRSSRNAVKHGLTAQRPLLHDEDPEEFDGFCAAMHAHYAPEGPIEVQMVERAANLMWRLRRVPTFEAALFTHVQFENETDPNTDFFRKSRRMEPLQSLDDGPRRMVEVGRMLEDLLKPDLLGKLTRYEVTLQNQLRVTLAELDHMKLSRPEPKKLEEAKAIELPYRQIIE